MYDEEGAKIVERILEKAKVKNVKIHLPCDFTTAEKFAEDAATGATTVEAGIPDEWMVNKNNYFLFVDYFLNFNEF